MTEEGEIDPNFNPATVLPFTEEQERKRAEMQLKYKNDETGLAIDSIEPEGGPITGETRVLVHGGPFEDMALLYPRPKCKFGSNDRTVEATYVKCHHRPLSMEENEGKSKDKVSWLAMTSLIPSRSCIDILVPAMRQQSRRREAHDSPSHDLAHWRLHRLSGQRAFPLL